MVMRGMGSYRSRLQSAPASYDEVFQDRSVNITLIISMESRNFPCLSCFIVCTSTEYQGGIANNHIHVAINQSVAINLIGNTSVLLGIG